MKKRILCAVLLCCTLLFSACAANDENAIPRPTEAFFVNDFAEVIDADDEAQINQWGQWLYQQSKAQVVVVTIPTLDDEAIEEYALELFRSWGIGDEEKNNGLLLLLSVEEPRVRIEVGTGLEGAVPDSKAGRLLDTYMIPHYRPGEFTVGLRDTYYALINEAAREYGLTLDENYTPMPSSDEEEEDGIFETIGAFAAIIIGLYLLIKHPYLFFLFFRGGGGRGGFGGGGGGFSGGDGSSSGGGASR